MLLLNKVAIVTGGAKGIGKAIVEEFASNGANIMINYNTSHKEAIDLKEKLELKYHVEICIKQGDISIPQESIDLVETTIKHFGKIDILINNAGAGLSLPSAFDVKDVDFCRVIDVNLKATFNCSMEVIKHMVKQGSGKIISISTSAVNQPRGGTVAYTASKAGIELIMNSLAQEFGPSGINLNIVAPGPTETEMLNQFFTLERKKQVENEIPLRRMAKPEDIAKATLFLSSSMADYITGQKIVVDGGRTIR
ncbi:glucose 1-dehydrogenase [Alkalibaculum sp. M08DMB]|uniref:Glucose 1-dehydrogenase n=1 Tax=Alkalibaculum sporogenes TaxID=2655001 RepID=A0A6A7K7L7_9FIRM|nr:glucose 1-dehydrogenase [Alkalibaculum sporogenes]MPW25341.1 glucose 1-dehydrogenase [Alkalibaculum sporogenes]